MVIVGLSAHAKIEKLKIRKIVSFILVHTVLKAIICGAQTIGTRLKICIRIKILKKSPAWGIEPGSSG